MGTSKNSAAFIAYALKMLDSTSEEKEQIKTVEVVKALTSAAFAKAFIQSTRRAQLEETAEGEAFIALDDSSKPVKLVYHYLIRKLV